MITLIILLGMITLAVMIILALDLLMLGDRASSA
jgi:hypothetical protein